MENARQPRQQAERAHQSLSCCSCLFPRSTPLEEVPMQDMHPPAEEAAGDQLVDVPLDDVNPEGMIGPQQPINQAEAGIPPSDQNERYADNEAVLGCREWQSDKPNPDRIRQIFIVVFFMLAFYFLLGQAFNVLSYDLGWRGNGKENASTSETDMIFKITTPMPTTISNAITSGYNATTFNG